MAGIASCHALSSDLFFVWPTVVAENTGEDQQYNNDDHYNPDPIEAPAPESASFILCHAYQLLSPLLPESYTTSLVTVL